MTMTRRLAVLDVSTDEAWMDTALKVAFASSDLKHVDQHFGSASCFVKYAVTPDEAHMAEVVQFEDTDQDGNENKLIAKMDALKDCAAVYVQAVGSSAMTQLRAINVQPVKVSNGTPIGEMIHALREELREGPRSWLARAIAQQRDPDRFSAMEADGWDE